MAALTLRFRSKARPSPIMLSSAPSELLTDTSIVDARAIRWATCNPARRSLPSNSLWARAVRSGLQVRPALEDPLVRAGRNSVSPRLSYLIRT